MDRAARDGWTRHDLSNQGLSELPVGIGQLAQFQELDLSRNQLTALSAQTGQLSRLPIPV
jgi:Leucine-rich repeat (LRR) protein